MRLVTTVRQEINIRLRIHGNKTLPTFVLVSFLVLIFNPETFRTFFLILADRKTPETLRFRGILCLNTTVSMIPIYILAV
jgi:uncharacterized membrane protein